MRARARVCVCVYVCVCVCVCVCVRERERERVYSTVVAESPFSAVVMRMRAREERGWDVELGRVGLLTVSSGMSVTISAFTPRLKGDVLC